MEEKNTLTLYHGTDHVLVKPEYGHGREDNDYGSGFYLTVLQERADEWALLNGKSNAVTNRYELDVSGLKIVDLDDYGPLAWIAEVIFHRGVSSDIAMEFKDAIIDKYKIDTSNADIIVGYRADDSYGDVIEAFLSGEITVDEVKKLFYKGELGRQYMLKSKLAFDLIKFVNSYYPTADEAAGKMVRNARKEVINFLTNRRIQIAKRFIVPQINVLDAIENNYVYVREGGYYERQ